jgi:hypothetical protein
MGDDRMIRSGLINVDCHNEKGKFYQENKAKKKKNDIENFILTK